MKCLAVVGSTNPKSISRQIADRWLNLIKATDADIDTLFLFAGCFCKDVRWMRSVFF